MKRRKRRNPGIPWRTIGGAVATTGVLGLLDFLLFFDFHDNTPEEEADELAVQLGGLALVAGAAVAFGALKTPNSFARGALIAAAAAPVLSKAAAPVNALPAGK